MANKLYREESGFSEIITIGLLSLTLLALLIASGVNAFTESANHNWALVYAGAALIVGGILYFLYRMKMKLVVSEKVIKFKMTPFHGKSRKIKWKNVAEYEVIKTHPLAPNHGSHLASSERRFSLSGRNGLSILMTDGARYFIGCRDVDRLEESLRELAV
ncbi:hypothetical protein [Neolewinella antarctica]|uniref:ABC-type anion transport system duplicated permease subunit n=1 Tax=Neolewinella antarctica TaxID=442734 RepID=A0ABX0XBY2_9BACT|nr:hypothetical protein [Neolewinella antarctica]NJC26443.1 ABC-type anion transport system duplicated permease subunit [Neolewinella antarctica]